MQKNLSENAAPKGPGKALKFVLMAFVAVSIGAAVYKIAAAPAKATVEPVQTVATAVEPARQAAKPAPKADAVVKPAAKAVVGKKTAVVYYFYTNTRCSSCKAIEAYTREAVETKLTPGYKDWKVEFRGVNIEDEPNAHFAQDYFLNSKSVVVQKFAGEKPLKWGKLEKVWQLLGDKKAFIDYVTVETHKLLDEK